MSPKSPWKESGYDINDLTKKPKDPKKVIYPHRGKRIDLYEKTK